MLIFMSEAETTVEVIRILLLLQPGTQELGSK